MALCCSRKRENVFLCLSLSFFDIETNCTYIDLHDYDEPLPVPYNLYDTDSNRESYFQQPEFMSTLSKWEKQWDWDTLGYPSQAKWSNWSLPEFQDTLLETRKDNISARYVSLYFNQYIDSNLIIVGANSSAYHAFPIAVNLGAKALAASISNASNVNITTASHPFPRTSSQAEILEAANAFMTAISFVVSLSLPCVERTRQEKCGHEFGVTFFFEGKSRFFCGARRLSPSLSLFWLFFLCSGQSSGGSVLWRARQQAKKTTFCAHHV